MEPFGLALKDYWKGNISAKVMFYRDDGLIDEYFVKHCFREPDEFSELEKKALNLCSGKVLDVGAGVGPHSLFLQAMGFDVYSLDISAEACDIMKRRGLKNVSCSDIYDLQKGNFDTILLLGRAIGLAGDLEGMVEFLEHCKNLLSSKGKIILDSLDVRVTTKPDHLAYQERNKKIGRYIGVVGLKMEYNGHYGQEFKLLHIDPDTLKTIAVELSWKVKILHQEENGDFLAKISK
ncbi:MAG: class I SAM-dependent methyltransferase [Candidatus Hermodarchaeota archaeon]